MIFRIGSHSCPHRYFTPNFAFAFAFVILKVINSEIILFRFALISVSMVKWNHPYDPCQGVSKFGRGAKTTISAVLRERPVLLRAELLLHSCQSRWPKLWRTTLRQRNYYENNSLRVIFRNFEGCCTLEISGKERIRPVSGNGVKFGNSRLFVFAGRKL